MCTNYSDCLELLLLIKNAYIHLLTGYLLSGPTTKALKSPTLTHPSPFLVVGPLAEELFFAASLTKC